MLARFCRYRTRVEDGLRDPTKVAGLPVRVLSSVYGYVLTDYADACWNFYLRSADKRFREAARLAYERAIAVDPENVFSLYRLYFLLKEQDEPEGKKRGNGYLRRAVELEPMWLDGNLALALEDAEQDRGQRILLSARTGDRRQREMKGRVFENLLPHEWLWAYDRAAGQKLSGRLLKGAKYERDRRWQREFDDVHVSALFTFGKVLSRDPSPSAAAEPIGPWKRAEGQQAARGMASKLFLLLQHRFYPDDFQLLLWMPENGNRERLRSATRRWLSDDSATYWALAGVARSIRRENGGGERDTGGDLRALIREIWRYPNRTKFMFQSMPAHYRVVGVRRLVRSLGDRVGRLRGKDSDQLKVLVPRLCRQEAMRFAVRGWLVNEPQPYWALRRLFETDPQKHPVFDDEEIKDVLVSVSKQSDRAPALYAWIADRLVSLGAEEEGEEARRRAGSQVFDARVERECQISFKALLTRDDVSDPSPEIRAAMGFWSSVRARARFWA